LSNEIQACGVCVCVLLSFYPSWDQIMQSQPIIESLIQRAPLFSLETPLSSVVAEEEEEKSERGKPRPSLFVYLSL